MAADERASRISVRIGEKLLRLYPKSSNSSSCIFKVHEQLRKVNEKAYEPQILAIGPYHRAKANLNMMEEHKVRYLQMLLRRQNEDDVTKYVKAMSVLEERARQCYQEHVNVDADEFVEMMLLDGCFIVELIRKFAFINLRDRNDPIFTVGWVLSSIKRDMLLVENQLPFFVVLELFGMTLVPNQGNIIYMTLNFFHSTLPGIGYARDDVYPIHEIKHLLGFIHDNWLPSPTGIAGSKKYSRKNKKWGFMRCAAELRETGVKFKKADANCSLFDVEFRNGVIEIPTLTIEDSTESFFRNLIAYEQCFQGVNSNYVTHYIKLMDCLINSPKDVELLRRCGIINNWLGDDKVIATIFNRLGDSVVISSAEFYYAKILNDVNMHCNRSWNVRMAKLSRNYCNSPWAFISFLAAVVLLLLTLTQTVYSVLSYYK